MFNLRWFAAFLLSLSTPLSAFAAPRITEIMAAGQAVIADEEGQFPDWIEIHNPDAAEIDLSGYRLTDDPAKPAKWTFPSFVIPPGGYRIVFCSEKDRVAASGAVHINFRLDSGGEQLQLISPTGVLVHEFRFPLQLPDLSFDGVDFLSSPTPGMANETSTVAVVRGPVFSVPRGFHAKAFLLTLTCETAGAAIHYTLDGTEPTPASARYTKPLTIAKTSCVRAAAFAEGKRPSPTVTQTYLFVSDIVKQSPAGQTPPGWPKSWGQNRVDYGMDPRIAARGKDAKALPGALKSIPSISIVMALPDLFDPAVGIYANPERKGREWERPMSLEVIYPDGSSGTQVNAGLRIRGGASRGPDNPKHNFRVLLRKEYGAEALEFPLFGADGASRTERFDLRCEQLIGWVAFPDTTADFIRDIYGRDTQLALGQPAKRGDFYHLYINGQYWGLYQTDERVGAEYAAEYFGGNEDDYDTVKINFDHDSTGGGTDFVDGSFGAWRRAVSFGHEGFESNENYFRVQGLNIDGSVNEAYEPLIDVDNLIDYMLAGIYIAADDSPPAFGTQNNWYGVRSRKGDFGFRFFAHDWEISMQDSTGQENRVGEPPIGNPFRTLGGGPVFLREGEPGEQEEELLDPTSANPWHFWQAMRLNPEFRLRVADHVHKHFFNDGALTQEKANARFRARMEEIDQAVIGESARWGDGRRDDGFPGPLFAQRLEQRRAAGEQPRLIQIGPGQDEDDLVIDGPINSAPAAPSESAAASARRKLKPYTRDMWLKACEQQALSFLSNRSSNVLEHLRAGLLYPELDAPTMAPFGGVIAGDEVATITAPATEAGPLARVYYTTNGDDPRLVGGAVSGSAHLYAAPLKFAKETTVKARAFDPAQNEWSALLEATFLPNSDFGALKLTEIHYQPPANVGGEGEFIEFQNTGVVPLDVSGFKIVGEISHTFPAGSIIAPGAYCVLARNATVFAAQYPGVTPNGIYTRRLGDSGGEIELQTAGGIRVLSVEYNNGGDFPAAADGFGYTLVYDGKGDPDEGKNWRASSALHGSPGSADTGWIPGVQIVISKVGVDELGGFAELKNISDETVVHPGWLIMGEQKYPLTNHPLAPGATRLIRVDDLGLALPVEGGELAFQLGFVLGEEEFGFGAIHRFPFGPATAGAVYARVIVSDGREFFPRMNEAQSAPKEWPVRIEEIHYQPGSSGVAEFVELANHSDAPINMEGTRLEGLDYFFIELNTIPAHGRALVVTTSPDVFRQANQVPAEVPIWRASTGSLQDNGERVAVIRTTVANGITPGEVMEELRYNDRSPWPIQAAGLGHSLQRINAQNYSAEPNSWVSGVPSPGRENTINAAPVVTLAAGNSPEQFVAQAQDPDGTVVKLEFIVDGVVIGSVETASAVFAYKPTNGIHDLWARATDSQGAVSLSNNITIDATGVPGGAGRGLLAEYFTNVNLEGAPAVSHPTQQIGGDWFHLDPAPGVSRQGFSARYSGKIVPRVNGMHRFSFRATGGLRMHLGGNLVIDQWADPNSMTPADSFHEVELLAGEALDLVIEYFDEDGVASLIAQWGEAGSFQETPLPAELLYLPSQDPAAIAIAVPQGLSRRFLGQPITTSFALHNAFGRAATWAVSAGQLPPGVTLGSDGSLSGKPSQSGVFVFSVSAQLAGEAVEIAPRTVSMRVIDRGIAAPVVKVLRPTAKVSSAGDVEASGEVISERPIARVRYTLNSGVWHELPGGADWNVILTQGLGLVGGYNNLSVQAEDDEGRLSSIVDYQFQRKYPSTLTVLINGRGSVTPGFAGTSTRVVGQQYRITATAAPGHIFAGWEGYGSERTIQFGMSEDLVLTANFVENPFLTVKGRYVAFIGTDEGDHRKRGRATVQLSNQGEFTGLIELGSSRFPLKGRLDPQGFATVYPNDPQTGRFISAALVFNLETQTFTIEVTVYEDAGAIVSTGQFSIVPWTARQPAPQRGRWNLFLPTDALPAPRGTGFVSLVASASGAIRGRVVMPDSRAVFANGYVDAGGRISFHASLGFDAVTTYGESLSGVILPDTTTKRATGELVWAGGRDAEVFLPRPVGALPPPEEPAPFSRDIEITGSLYRPPAPGQLIADLSDARLLVEDGASQELLSKPTRLVSAGRFTFETPDANETKLKVDPGSGLFTGTILLPSESGPVRARMTGLIDQLDPAARGQFVDSAGNVGSVKVIPQ